jgi:hypothetical protein
MPNVGTRRKDILLSWPWQRSGRRTDSDDGNRLYHRQTESLRNESNRIEYGLHPNYLAIMPSEHLFLSWSMVNEPDRNRAEEYGRLRSC